jgi:hypothetical protein
MTEAYLNYISRTIDTNFLLLYPNMFSSIFLLFVGENIFLSLKLMLLDYRELLQSYTINFVIMNLIDSYSYRDAFFSLEQERQTQVDIWASV